MFDNFNHAEDISEDDYSQAFWHCSGGKCHEWKNVIKEDPLIYELFFVFDNHLYLGRWMEHKRSSRLCPPPNCPEVLTRGFDERSFKRVDLSHIETVVELFIMNLNGTLPPGLGRDLANR